jgi:hypothetical protein
MTERQARRLRGEASFDGERGAFGNRGLVLNEELSRAKARRFPTRHG